MAHERQPYADVHRPVNRGTAVDMQEVLKREIYRQGNEGDNSYRFSATGVAASASAVGASSQPMGFEDVELYFDSTQRDTSSDYTVGEIRWSVPLLSNLSDVKNCIEMKIGTFYFPKIYASTGAPEYLYFRRIFLEFQNAPSTQAVLGPNNNKFHFEFDVQNIGGQAVKLVPLKDTFFFQRPITSITDYQVRFLVPPTSPGPLPWKKIPLPKETVTVTSLTTGGFGYNPIRFRMTGTDTTAILGPIGAITAPGLVVFMNNYTSNIVATNNAVNNLEGIYVTNILDATDFEITGINATTVNAEFPATMYIPKNRIAFPVRFTSVRDSVTNYIEVGHT